MTAKFNSKTLLKGKLFCFIEPFRLRLHSKIEKVLKWVLKISNKQYGYKNAEFDAYFESFEKSARKLMWKFYQKNDIKMKFYYYAQKFCAYNFLGEHFCTFFNGFKLSIALKAACEK